MRNFIKFIVVVILVFTNIRIWSQTNDSMPSLFSQELSIEDILKIKTNVPSTVPSEIFNAPSNVTIITQIGRAHV